MVMLLRSRKMQTVSVLAQKAQSEKRVGSIFEKACPEPRSISLSIPADDTTFRPGPHTGSVRYSKGACLGAA